VLEVARSCGAKEVSNNVVLGAPKGAIYIEARKVRGLCKMELT
jgi:hypothetical protein